MKRLPLSARRRDKGVALIIVLSMLVLLSGLLVAFLTTARTERTAAASDSATAASRQIADSTVSFVISQIRDATTIPAENTTWASQPGAIRTFSGSLNGSRKLLKDGAYYDGYSTSSNDFVFKLYSADRMKVSSSQYSNQDLLEETTLIESWDRTSPVDDYVDLNEPALSLRRDLDSEGNTVEPRYPIVDPRAFYNKNDRFTDSIPDSKVEGFDAKVTLDDIFKLPGGDNVPYVPMPVKWLYVLKDGTIGPASLGSKENPIVGRTAFWTDDDSCKLNINTASEGTFWDTPTASSAQECGNYGKNSDIPGVMNGLNLAGSQAVQGEFQRYPGHPATTCLSPVFGWLYDLNHTGSNATKVYPYVGAAKNLPYQTFKEAIYQISPYLPYDRGTSQGAIRNTDTEASLDGSLKVKTKHLYTSVDELLFKSSRFKGNGGDPDINGKLTPAALEQSRFFLTANSRAPEINLFSRPRVTIWPINADYKYRTATDDLFIFTSKITKNLSGDEKTFCIYRGDAKYPSRDFQGTWPAVTDPNVKTQNIKMFNYLQNMTSRSIPGFGKTFSDAAKWGGSAGRDQVLLEVFDYIRTVNLVDTGTTTRLNNVFAPYTPKFFLKAPPPDQYSRYDRSYDWSGQVTPLRRQPDDNDPYQGLGRFVQPIEVSVIFHGTTPPAGKPGGRYMKATMAIEMATVMGGFPAIRETYWTRITPINGPTGEPRAARIRNLNPPPPIAGQPPYVPEMDIHLCGNINEQLVNIQNLSSHEVAQGRSYMPTLGYVTSMYYFKQHKGFTLLQQPHLPETNRDPTMAIYTKKFDNSRPESRYPGVWSTSAGNAPTGGNGTISVYPYVSDAIYMGPTQTNDTPPKPVPPQKFEILDLGRYKIEVFAGEGPKDPRSGMDTTGGDRPVQTLYVSFPLQKIGPFDTPTTRDFHTRLLANENGDAGNLIETPNQFIYRDKAASGNSPEVFGDIVRSMQLVGKGFYDGNKKATAQAGDFRLASANREIPDDWWTPVDDMSNYVSTSERLHRLQRGHGDPEPDFSGSSSTQGNLATSAGMRGSKPPLLPKSINGVKRADGGPGDWDRGVSKHMSGAMANKVDEGNLKFDPSKTDYTGMPYFRGRGIEETGQTFFSPNRQLSSAVMFGSLPTGVTQNKPWQTLLFRPNRETGTTHPGADVSNGPPDHLFLDLFTLPVVEPYAISEPFSTAGKVNLNYVIAPFGYARGSAGNNPGTANARSYLRRDTGVRGVMKSTFIMAIPTGQADGGYTENPQSNSVRFRYPIDLNKTIEAMETRLKAKSDDYPLFRSATELCTVDLYPQELSVGTWNTFYENRYALTGDNMRERPYAHIYPRVTTKSNVYTVHMRCQAIRKAQGTNPDEFDPEKDVVLGEYRGSATIERFVDPNDQALLDYDELSEKIDPYYRYRVINTKQFSAR